MIAHTAYLLDLAQLRTMTGNDDDFIRDVLEMVRASGPENKSEISRLYHNREFEQLGKTVHRFKSSVSILGNPDILGLTASFERAARERREEDMQGLFPTFMAMIDSVLGQVNAELGGARATG